MGGEVDFACVLTRQDDMESKEQTWRDLVPRGPPVWLWLLLCRSSTDGFNQCDYYAWILYNAVCYFVGIAGICSFFTTLAFLTTLADLTFCMGGFLPTALLFPHLE